MRKKKAKAVTSLETLPRTGIRHSWADYVELLCLFNIDREMSKDVLVDRFKEGQDTGDSLDDETDDDEDAAVAAEPETDEPADEKLDAKAEDLFRHLKYRESAFGRKYPFAVDMDHRRITLERTTGPSRLYLFLLLASNLRYFNSLTHRLTTDFETVSRIALGRMLPKVAKVYLFHGAGRSGRYKGHLFTKLALLAGDLYETMTVEEDDFEDGDVGDGGLDLIGWVPMPDNSPGLLLCLAQCACTDKWVKKQRETMAINEVMTVKGNPARLTFIPFCFRKPNGEWFSKHKVETVVLDRLRLLHLLNTSRQYQRLESFKKIGDLIEGTEPLI